MTLVKSGQIANCCQPNALVTLKEYLEDYAAPQTKTLGERAIVAELEKIPNEKIRAIAAERLRRIEAGERDFRF
jgi:2-iminoacetate synthase